MSVKLLKTSFYFTLLSTVASAINFAFYPIISHLLSVSDFGDVQLGVSFIMLAAALLTSLSTLALFTTANKKKDGVALGSIERLVISLSIVLAALTVLLAQPVSNLLQLQDASLLYILAVIFVLNVPASTWLGALQGGGQFLTSGWISAASALIKLLAALLLILAGLGAHGALLGIALGSLSILPLVKIFDRSRNIHYKETFGVFKLTDFYLFIKRPDILGILVSLLLVSLIASIDIIAAKILLSPHDAGAYAQISTVAKIPYFACLPISLVLFERYIRRSVSLRLSLLAFSGIAAAIGMLVVLLSDVLLRIIFNYQSSDQFFLVPLTIGFVSYSILMLSLYQLIAARDIVKVVVVSALSLTVTVLAISGSEGPSDIVYAYMYSTLGAMLLSALLAYTKKYE